jgi:CAAD domains of cyanobacterial aminoacyl-tRNA synthetase
LITKLLVKLLGKVVKSPDLAFTGVHPVTHIVLSPVLSRSLSYMKHMNPDVKESEVDVSLSEFEVQTKAPLVKVSTIMPSDETTEQLKHIWEQVIDVLSGPTQYLSGFWTKYERVLITLGLVFASIVSVKMTLALLAAVGDVPLLAPGFELIGMGYTAWFIYRYLWKAQNRHELSNEISTFRDQVFGQKD